LWTEKVEEEKEEKRQMATKSKAAYELSILFLFFLFSSLLSDYYLP